MTRCESIVDAFNAKHPVGSIVIYWVGARAGKGRLSVTRSAAWLLSGLTPVVLVQGYQGPIALTHIQAGGGE